MTISIDWWGLPALVTVCCLFLTRRLLLSDLFSMVVAGGFSAGMGLAASLLTLLVWGVTH